ncbi:MAG TPA: sodium:proton antiporter [Bacteroidota bacterium]|nr:sodium:proton antiporter [Bacteroidota bacterium]
MESVNPLLTIPFIALLAAIAVAPFINRHWWEKNYPVVSTSLGGIVVAYYLFILGNVPRVLLTLHEYVSFIVLIGSLFIVSGGIHFQLKGKAEPVSNVAILAFGALISNLVGTTGASMLLIRPYIRVNKFRIKPFHIIFFIFIVSNVGGALTPIGDPPLFLGYLKGIPFFWVVENTWTMWGVAIGLLLAVFYFIDRRSFHHESKVKQREAIEQHEHASFDGLANLGYLLAILVGVFIEHPFGAREAIMCAAAAGSYFTTSKRIHEKNDFNFEPIKEVAILFLGIFATMMPALDWLQANARLLGVTEPGHYYWASGALSSFLDNAPTYLNFLTASFGYFNLTIDDAQQVAQFLAVHARYVQAISIGAVFFGACTYIGNGPNFMVKSIAEQSGVRMPSFFGYIVRYTLPVLIPIYTLIWFLFFR